MATKVEIKNLLKSFMKEENLSDGIVQFKATHDPGRLNLYKSIKVYILKNTAEVHLELEVYSNKWLNISRLIGYTDKVNINRLYKNIKSIKKFNDKISEDFYGEDPGKVDKIININFKILEMELDMN